MGKVVKRKGMGSSKFSKTKMDFKTEMRGLTYIYKTKSSVIFFKHHQYQDQVYHIHEIFSLHCSFSNFNCYSTTKAKDLINFPSSFKVFALTPDILVVRTKRNRNRDLTMNI